uniref:(California timema) hypothetical protein n=1 Tax=Timema californicum TaxID=61474 RepID=A0A7R9J6H6_TIMCA|nr:unnamed protein product [Timema californicum]
MLMKLFLRGPIIPTSAVLRGTPRTLSDNGSCDKFSKGSPKYFPMPEIRRFLAEAMMKVGACEEHSLQLADVLAEADYAGHYSHGLNRIEMYVRDAQTGKCDVNVKPCVLKDTVSTAWVEGNNGLGMVVGSNHYGIASWYSAQALKKCMLAALGTNPLSLAAPALKRDSFILDMATSAVAVGKIEVKMKAQQPIPEGWAQDAEGNITTDASVAFKASHLMPLGGSEETSGYKGYGLAMLVETLCGVLAGSLYGPRITKWMDKEFKGAANLGQCFIAVNPECFAPGFVERMSDLMCLLRNLEPICKDKPVLVPGDPEKINMKKVNELGGVPYSDTQINNMVVDNFLLGVYNSLAINMSGGLKVYYEPPGKVSRTGFDLPQTPTPPIDN